MAMNLPEGFVLDEEQPNTTATPMATSNSTPMSTTWDLPVGFVLDNEQPQAIDPVTAKLNLVDSIIAPAKYYGQSIVKGVAEGAAGINSGLAGVTRLLDSPIYDTKALSQAYASNADLMRKVAKEAEAAGGTNWTLNTVASLPFGMAEFGTATNPISIVAAAGMVGAMKDYGEAIAQNPEAEFNMSNIQAGAQNATLTAGTMGAINVAGAAIENVAKLIQKHGVSTIRNMFSAINGGDERMGQKALDILSDPNYNKKAKLADITATAEKNAERIELTKSKTVEMVKDSRRKIADDMFQRDRDFDFGVRQLSSDVKATSDLKLAKADADIAELVNARDASLQKLGMDNKDEIAGAAVKIDQAIKNAQVSVQDYIEAVFTGMYKKVEHLKQQTGKAVGETWDKLITSHPQEGVKAEQIWERLKSADAGENLFTFSRKDGQVKIQPHKSNPQLNGIAKQMEMEINTSFNDGGIATGNVMKITHDFFEAASNMPADKGATLPGIGKIYGNLAEAFHVRNYADSFSPSARAYVDDIINLNQKYGSYKNKMADTYARYFKKEGDSFVPKTDQIFGRFDRGDTRYA
jgi:hypothetical protein